MQRGSRGIAVGLAVFLTAFAVLVMRVPTIERFLANADHGYQLAAGAELLRGNLPGVQSVSNYGPLIAVLSAGTLWATGNLVAEALVCALAWATAIWLAYHLVQRSFGTVPGLVATGAAFLCMARFHKWYVWLIPMAALATLGAAAATATRRRWLAGGLVCGIGALMRPEFGIAALAVLGVVAVSDARSGRGIAWPSAWTTLALGFLGPLASWGAILLVVTGSGGLASALAIVPETVVGSVAHWSRALYPFALDDPLSPRSAHALTLGLLPVVEALAIAVGGWLVHRARRRDLTDAGRTLAAIGLMGLACYPHTVYRADILHLWQGIWPLLLAVPALVALGLATARTSAVAAALLAAVVVVVLTPIVRRPHFDLAPFGRAPLAGLAELARGLDAAPEDPTALLVAAIDRLTTPDQKILILTYSPQLLYFADRGPVGRCLVYQRGLFESPAWRHEHRARIEAHPPALVVAPRGFEYLAIGQGFRAGQPEIYEYVRAHYAPVGGEVVGEAVETQGELVLLAPTSTASPPT